MNAKKLSIIGLALVCAFSLAGNLYLYQQKSSLTVQLAKQTKTVDELTEQAEDSNAKITVLQAQLDACTIDNVVVDTPEQAQAEQSTQGAADKTQQQAPTGQQAIEQDLNKQIPEKTMPPKTDKLPDASSSQAQNPTNQDVNDYLNDILNGGQTGGTSSKPSGGSSGGQVAPGQTDSAGNTYLGEARPGGADGVLDNPGSNDQSIWD